MDERTAFSVEVAQRHLKVSGALDLSSTPRLLQAVLQSKHATLDLSGVPSLDSTGLHALIRIRGVRKDMRIVALSAPVRRLLDLTETAEYLLADPPSADAIHRWSHSSGTTTTNQGEMTADPRYTVEFRPLDRQWVVRRTGISRATSVHSSQREAERMARHLARRRRIDMVVNAVDGSVERRYNYRAESTNRSRVIRLPRGDL